MSEKNYSPKSIARLAYAVCILSSGAATAGEIAPKLLKTTKPIRVNSSATDAIVKTDTGHPDSPASKPVAASESSSPEQVATVVSPLRVLLEPGRCSALESSVAQTSGGVPRTNHFFELQSDREISKPAGPPATRSAALPRRSHARGSIRNNPLVVDAPPQLRRFNVDQRPLNLPVTESTDPAVENLVIRAEPLPARPVDDLDQTLEMLSADTSENTAVLGAAKNRGFGMLAIDQIGEHLEPTGDETNAMTYPPLQRFATDLVLPDDSARRPQAQRHQAQRHHTQRHHTQRHHTLGQPSERQQSERRDTSKPNDDFRDQLRSMDTQRLTDQYTPQLPPASQQLPPASQQVTLPEQVTQPEQVILPKRSVIAVQPAETEPARDPTQPLNAATTPTAELASRKTGAQRTGKDYFATLGLETGGLETGLSTPIASLPKGQVALEVEDLIAATSQQAITEPSSPSGKPQAMPTKPSFAERFTGWSKRLATKTRSPKTRSPESRSTESRSSAANKSSAGVSSDQHHSQPAPAPRRRSGGILTQWLNRSR